MTKSIFATEQNFNLNLKDRDGKSLDYIITVNSILDEELNKSFEVFIKTSELDQIKNFKLSNIAKNTNMNGFRPGKAPLTLVWKKFQDEISNEIKDNVINSSAELIITKLGRELVSAPQINIKEFSYEVGFKFNLAMLLMPEFDLPDLTKIEIEQLVYEITDKDIADKMQELHNENKKYIDTDEKYKAANNDIAIIDFEGKIDNELFAGGSSKNHSLKIGSKSFIDNFEEQIIGHKIGDELLIKVTFPENYHHKDFQNKEAEFAVKINMIQKASGFADNAELAKHLGFETEEALLDAVKKSIDSQASNSSRIKIKTELFDRLNELCEFTIPQVMMDQEFKTLWSQVENIQKQSGEKDSKDEEKLKNEYQALAKRRVKLGIVLSAFAKKFNVKIEQNDIIESIKAHAMSNPQHSQAIINYYMQNQQAVESLKGPIIEEKAVKEILSKVKLIDKTTTVKKLLKAGNE